MTESGQKFIAKNRAPRVQIEYDVEVGDAQRKVNLPFVMGVMSNLSGNSGVEKAPLGERKFLEVDVDNFNDRMKAIKPGVSCRVKNTLTGEGELPVQLAFEKMDDLSPAAVAAQVEPLKKLLEARTQLENLITYMDGKTGAEELIAKLLSDKALLETLSKKPETEGATE